MNDFEFVKVDKESRRGFLSMLVMMLGFTFFSASMWTGGQLGTGLSFNEFVLCVIIGNLILAVYTGGLAYIGAKTGLSTHLLAKNAFGEKGFIIASLLLAITQIGWFGVGVAMFALPVHLFTGISFPFLVVVSGILMTATAYFGIKALIILSFIAVPSITILGLTSVNMAISSVGGFSEFTAISPLSSISMVMAVTMVIGSFISGGTLTADFTRFAKTPKIAVVATVIAFFIGNTLMFTFGAVGSKIFNTADISEVLYIQGLVIPAIIILGFNIWTTNDNALYASGLALSTITKIPKKKIVVICGLLGTALASPLYNNFVGWLSILNVFLPPIGAILITHYLINKNSLEQNVNFRVPALLAYAIGVVASFYIPFVPALTGIAVTVVSYLVILKISEVSVFNANYKTN